ncbi:hypothetical protein B1no1_00340 [Thermolongibacillus altinsuensis]|nr:hypothetical protein B1no1_00340 [Thermolongibacillus altinsuensis]
MTVSHLKTSLYCAKGWGYSIKKDEIRQKSSFFGKKIKIFAQKMLLTWYHKIIEKKNAFSY